MTDGPALPLADGGAHAPGPARQRSALGWWALLAIPLWLVLIAGTSWEPVMRDGWGHLVWHRNHARGDWGYLDFLDECYYKENPRLGQIPTLLAYAPGPHHPIVTPLLELAVLWLLTAVALGRRPSLRCTSDALAAALVTAIVFACAPQIGPMLFYRPFTWNYLFGLALNLGWLLPYRRAALVAEASTPHRLLAPGLFVLGVAAGMCNEHTGIAFGGMAALATLVAWRRGGLRAWMIAGLVGFAAGYAILLTAPAQQMRYGALAQQAGIVERIIERGVAGNLRVLGGLALALAPALPLVGLGLAARRAAPAAAVSVAAPPADDRRSHAVLALAGVVCTLTLLASPKLGPRLYVASVALIAAGLTGWLIRRLTGPAVRRWRRVAGGLAAAALVFVAIQLVAVGRAAGPAGAVRRERVERGPLGTSIIVPRLPAASRYFLGDDLVVAEARDLLAREYGLQGIELAPER